MFKHFSRYAYVLIFLLTMLTWSISFSSPLFKQSNQIMPAEQAFSLLANQPDSNSVQLQWQINPQAYLYQSKVALTYLNNESSPLFEYTLPAGELYQDPNFGEQIIYRQQLTLDLALSSEAALPTGEETRHIRVHYQGCHQKGFCYPPQTADFQLTFRDQIIAAIDPIDLSLITTAAEPGLQTEPEARSILDELLKKLDTKWSWAIFYLLGVLLGFTPCVLPMLPILAGIIAGPALNHHPRKAFRLTLVYVLSIAITYALAGIATAKLGASLQGELQRPIYIVLFALLFVYLGLSQIGIATIRLPNRFHSKLSGLQDKHSSGTYIGAFILGVLATLLASPCVTAPLVAILGFIAQTGNLWFGALSLFMLGLGMGTILLIAGTLGSQYLPRAGAWMERINQLIAVLLFGLSIWMLSRILHPAIILGAWGGLCLVIAYFLDTFHLRLAGMAPRIGSLFLVYGLILILGATQGHTSLIAPFSSKAWHSDKTVAAIHAAAVSSQAELNEAMQTALNETKPVMLDFYADWCISCQHLEKQVFRDHTVHHLLDSFFIIKVDITHFNQNEKALMREYAVIAPPTLIFFDQTGKEMTDYRIVGEVSAQSMARHLQQLKSEWDRLD